MSVLPVDTVREFSKAFELGQLCLHPTDTLLGLTFDPNSELGLSNLCAYKKRSSRKGFVHLASSIDVALAHWQPLPGFWPEILRTLWPAALTVVWRAVDPAYQGTQDGALAIRVPLLTDNKWFRTCLQDLQFIPSTSVNISGEAPLSISAAISRLKDDSRFYIPSALQRSEKEAASLKPSTIIMLQTDGKFSLLRPGAFDVTNIKSAELQYRNGRDDNYPLSERC